MEDSLFKPLTNFLTKIPAVQSPIGTGMNDEGLWWVKFQIDIEHQLAWHVVQEFACVINYLSVNERLPTNFFPVSPAPYLNGGPAEYLSWVIETQDKEFSPESLMQWLEARLPNPVDQLEEWDLE